MPIDAGARHAKYRVDSSKPVDRKTIPRVLVDIVVDTEEDRGRTPASGCVVQLQGRLSVCHAAVVSAGEIRRRRPTGLAVLEVADYVQTRGAQRVRVRAGDGLCLEVRTRPRLGHVVDYPVI